MKRNFFVYFTAFFCGMSVMAVELSASRLLAPTFGTSQIIWTVIIGIIMISLSLGNILGGRAADKYNSPDRLYTLIGIAAIWIALIPLLGKYIIDLSALALMWILPRNLIISGSVISCLVIFSAPLVILGMVSPFLVKMGVGASQTENNGKTIGEIYALSTIGSIIGTFIPTFLTIPVIGTGKTFGVFSLVLSLLSLYYFVKHKRRVVRSVVATVIVLVLALAPISNSYAFWEDNLLYEGESLYNYLQVKEEDDSVILSTNVAFGVQSIYKKNSPLSGMYYDYALMAPMFIPEFTVERPLDVLVLGMGTGTYAKECRYFFPESRIDGVEIDDEIVRLSRQYFDLQEDEAKVYINDGRTFLKSTDARLYDVIMVDAYHDITIPFHMSTREFFTEVKSQLKPNGVLLMNINIRSEKDTQLHDYLTETVKSCMQKVYTYKLTNGTNTILYASDNPDFLSDYSRASDRLSQDHPLKPISKEVSSNLQEVKEARHILTDDKAPVEVMGQKVLDEIVLDSLGYFKEQIGSSKNGILDVFSIISEE